MKEEGGRMKEEGGRMKDNLLNKITLSSLHYFRLPPSAFILPPSSFILRPSSFRLHPSFCQFFNRLGQLRIAPRVDIVRRAAHHHIGRQALARNLPPIGREPLRHRHVQR